MRFKTTLAALAALLVGPALAADLPVKAPVAQAVPFYAPYNGSGWYFGLEAGGGAGSAGVSGVPGVNNAALTVTDGLVGGIVGFSSDMSNGQRYWFAEADIGWNNLNGNTAGFSLTGPLTLQGLVGVGAPASQVLAWLPTFGLTAPTLPGLPPGVTASNPHVYFAAGVDISDISTSFNLASNTDWQFAPLVAMGLESQLSSGGTIGARVEDVFQASAVCVGGQCSKMGNLIRAKVLLKF